MIKTIVLLVPNHALGHTVEAISLAMELKHHYNVLFMAEQDADKVIKSYGFEVLGFPERDMFPTNRAFFFDAFIDDCIEALLTSIKPQMIVSSFPCFTFSGPSICYELGIPHVGIYGQFSTNTLSFLSENSKLVISSLPSSLAYSSYPNVHFVGPLLMCKPPSTEEEREMKSLVGEPFVLVSMGGGGRYQETSYMQQTVGKVAVHRPDLRFVSVGEPLVMDVPMPTNVWKLGRVQPHIMAFLEKQCMAGIFRAGKSLIELVAYRKPFIALSLSEKSEQIQRSAILDQAGACEHIFYEQLEPETLLAKLDLVLTRSERYVKAQNDLGVVSGTRQATVLIEELLGKDSSTPNGSSTRYYPFANGVIQVEKTAQRVRIKAVHNSQESSITEEHSKEQLARLDVARSLLVPDWLLSHSPYSVKKLLGAYQHKRIGYSGSLSIHSMSLSEDAIEYTGVINGHNFLAVYKPSRGSSEEIEMEVKTREAQP